MTPRGGVDRYEFRILVENMSMIDELLDGFHVGDSDHTFRLSEKDFRKAACITAHDFIGGDKIGMLEADKQFRQKQIGGYVLFDEFIEWMTDRRRIEDSGHRDSGGGGGGGPSSSKRLEPRAQSRSPVHRGSRRCDLTHTHPSETTPSFP